MHAQSLNNLYYWVKKNKYCGYDLYDGLNNSILKNLRYSYTGFLIIQFNKHSPINFRPILKIKKGISQKGTALFTISYAHLYDLTKSDIFLDEIKMGLDFIIKKSLISKYGYHCWACFYYPYVTFDKSGYDSSIPHIIATTRIIISLVKVYNILQDEELKDFAIDATRFITSKDMIIQKRNMIFFNYTLLKDKTIVLNASAQALEAIANVLSIRDDSEIRSIAENVVLSLIKLQHDDGSWDYSIYESGKRRGQLDFHQGYMIDGLLAFLPFASSDIKDQIERSIYSGVNVYKKQFLSRGQSFYRYPQLYPTDIHHQAQGVITFSKLYNSTNNDEYLQFARKILIWTIENMQDPSGFFYYQSYGSFKNKIPYMRWGQAWMMLALATFLSLGENL